MPVSQVFCWTTVSNSCKYGFEGHFTLALKNDYGVLMKISIWNIQTTIWVLTAWGSSIFFRLKTDRVAGRAFERVICFLKRIGKRVQAEI
ncbi:MAG: hypothetical protein ABS46_05615 [Cytophagaceae bacterium SCN 52-12]|nr:MAG: hypothetical protein ABS46_05615 [Cytophagaceae bacterium SCN 52-12]